MNRYRTTPGLGYECKAAVQERPYVSRPSRTQQLQNPRLKPRLTEDSSNELLRRQGVADEQLARAQTDRNSALQKSEENHSEQSQMQRERATSVSSSDSVSTISTNRSRSRSHSAPLRRRKSPSASPQRPPSDSNSPSARKRKRRYSSCSRSPPSSNGAMVNKNRRHRSISPGVRGRPNSARRGSNRSRSRSGSVDKSAVTRHRRSMDDNDDRDTPRSTRKSPTRFAYRKNPQTDSGRPDSGARYRKQRSPSPYSRRLALTQAMNMGR